jgi:hypothetical protein
MNSKLKFYGFRTLQFFGLMLKVIVTLIGIFLLALTFHIVYTIC